MSKPKISFQIWGSQFCFFFNINVTPLQSEPFFSFLHNSKSTQGAQSASVTHELLTSLLLTVKLCIGVSSYEAESLAQRAHSGLERC